MQGLGGFQKRTNTTVGYPEVDVYADLPPAASVSGLIYVVLNSSGTSWWLTTKYDAGMWYSNGATWTHLGDTPSYFYSDTFRIRDSADTSKMLAFDLSGISAITTRTLTIPNANGTIALLEREQTFTAAQSISTTGSLALYNTVDQTTNYERVTMGWSSNIFTIGTGASGTGTVTRAVRIGSSDRYFYVQGSPSITGFFNMAAGTGGSPATIFGITGAFSGVASIQNSQAILNTVAQSGTAGYRGLWISPFLSTVGSGNYYLIDAGTNSAANGGGTHTSRFSVTSTGVLTSTAAVTASALLARAMYVNPTLTASANNDVLVALDIAPTFTLGAFTGLRTRPLRVTYSASISASGIGLQNTNASGWTEWILNNDNNRVDGCVVLGLGGSTSSNPNEYYIDNRIGAFALYTFDVRRSTWSSTGTQLHTMSAQSSGTTPFITYTQLANTGGSAGGLLWTAGAHTGQTASTEIVDQDWNNSAILTHATGNYATQRTVRFRGRTHAFVGSSTITDMVNVEIDAPVLGTNALATNIYALRLGGNLNFSSGNLYFTTGTSVSIGTVDQKVLSFITGSAARTVYTSFGNQTHTLWGASSGTVPFITYTQAANTGGSIGGLLWTAGASTGQTASTEITDQNWNNSAILTFATGNIALQRTVRFQGRTFAFVGSSTITDLINVEIDSPVLGTNALATNIFALGLNGNLRLSIAGNGIYVKEGTNATMGTATLVAGTVTVNTTKVTANSRIFITIQSLGTVAVPMAMAITARTAGTDFTITSVDGTDTSVISWVLIEPA